MFVNVHACHNYYFYAFLCLGLNNIEVMENLGGSGMYLAIGAINESIEYLTILYGF